MAESTYSTHCTFTSQGTHLATSYFCSISIYISFTWKSPEGCGQLCCVMLCLLLWLLHQPGTHLDFLRLLEFSSSFPACTLSTMGSANSAHSEIQWDNWYCKQDQRYSNFEVFNIALLTTVLYVRFPRTIHLIGFNSTWTMNFWMFKLDLGKAEEAEIKLPTSVGSLKKQERARKTSTSALLIMPKPLTVWITTNWKILQEMGTSDQHTCLLRNLYAGQEVTELDMKQQTDSK